MDPASPTKGMTKEQAQLFTQECNIRHLFVVGSSTKETAEPHLMLLNVFDDYQNWYYQDETFEEQQVPKLLRQSTKMGLRGSSIVVDKQQFMQNWNKFTHGILEGLDWSNLLVAGGSVLANLCHENEGFGSSDVDIFLYGISEQAQADKKLKHIYDVVKKNYPATGEIE